MCVYVGLCYFMVSMMRPIAYVALFSLQRVEERRKDESLVRNVIERHADVAADPAFVEDILKQAEKEKDKMQRKVL